MRMPWPLSLFVSKPPKARAFEAARVSRLESSWMASTASIDADLRGGLVRVRNRSRELIQNNDFARGARRDIVVNVVGQGVGMQGQAKMKRGNKPDRETNRMIESAWWKWQRAKNCDVAGSIGFQEMEQLLIGTVVQDGEALVRKVYQKFGDSKVPLALELIEPDMLDESYNEDLGDGRKIRLGVEKNQWGRPIAYHFLSTHPGDHYIQVGPRQGLNRRRIPANEIFHFYLRERIQQSRGVPWLASTAIRLHHMGGYEQAEVIGARTAASQMGFIESPEGQLIGDNEAEKDQPGAMAALWERLTDFAPGVFKYLRPGEKIHVPDMKRPGANFGAFFQWMLRGFAVGIGASYEGVSADYSQTNYSSSRLSILKERDYYRLIQGWFIANFHQPLYEEWIELAVLSGEVSIKDFELRRDNYLFPRWMARGWAWVDPAKEIAAAIAGVRGGITTLTDIHAQAGGDFEEYVATRKREKELLDEAGIVLDSDPDKRDGKGAMLALAAAAGAGDDKPPKEGGQGEEE